MAPSTEGLAAARLCPPPWPLRRCPAVSRSTVAVPVGQREPWRERTAKPWAGIVGGGGRAWRGGGGSALVGMRDAEGGGPAGDGHGDGLGSAKPTAPPRRKPARPAALRDAGCGGAWVPGVRRARIASSRRTRKRAAAAPVVGGGGPGTRAPRLRGRYRGRARVPRPSPIPSPNAPPPAPTLLTAPAARARSLGPPFAARTGDQGRSQAGPGPVIPITGRRIGRKWVFGLEVSTQGEIAEADAFNATWTGSSISRECVLPVRYSP